METSILDTVARKIVWKIVEDLSDRRGLRQEWEQIDKETQKEIKEKWGKIVKLEIEKTQQERKT